VSGGEENIPYKTEITIKAQANPGYMFKHWEEDGKPVYYNANWTFAVTHSRDLTAIFEVETYDVLLYASPADGGKVWDDHYKVPRGEEITVYAEAKPYHHFKEWTNKDGSHASGDAAYTFTVIQSRELTAHFTPVTSKITLIAIPDGGAVLEGGGEIVQGKEHAIIAHQNIGYRFVDWREEGVFLTADTIYNFTVDENDHTFVANFEYKAYNINLSANPSIGGSVSGGGLIPLRTQITVKAEPEECYSFVNWTENGIPVWDEPDYTFIVDKDRDLVANFVRENFTITTAANPPLWGTAAGGGTDIACKTEITVMAIPVTGYRFVNWTKNGAEVSTDSIYTFPAMESCELTANFAENIRTITLIANPPDLGTVSGGGNYLYGETITVSARAISGYSLINWTENGVEVSKNADYTFTVTASRVLVANFDTTYFTVTVLSNDTLYGTACCTKKYKENEMAQVNAFVKQGYRFLNWTEEDTIRTSSQSYSFEVTRNITLTANFYGLDFDTYAATLWDNTFMLDLKKLEEEGYDITVCKWFKNNKWEVNTHTIDQYSYSAGPKITDKLELAPTYYYFQLTTKNGSLLYSTKKILTNHIYYTPPPNNNLYVYPNPATSGSVFTVENAIAGAPMQVYNQYGVCVKTIMATDSTVTLSLNLPAGIYLIRNEHKEAKVVIR
jgi:hypothetical protein